MRHARVAARLLAVLIAALFSFSLAAQDGELTLTPAQEARAQHLGSTLRCPVCRGLPITESPNELSTEMLREVREQIAAGHSDEQIYAYFAARFGESVLLDPPKRGLNLALWALPAFALLGGAWALVGYLRRASSASQPPVDRDLLARVERDVEAGR